MHSVLIAALGTVVLASAAQAQPVRATYEVYAAGLTVVQMEAVIDVTGDGYRIATTLRTRGLAAAVVSGEQASGVTGAWNGAVPMPQTFRSEGVWRGRARRTVLEWQAGQPLLRDLVPANEEEREAVPADLQRGTIDALSAVALLARTVQRSGACEATAAVFDGRRRSDYASRTEGWSAIQPWRGAWHGQALRCGFEARQVAGFRRDQERADAAAPQAGTAWIAAPFQGAPPIPVRIEVPSRWLGTATVVLLRAEPSATPVNFRQ